MLLLLLLLLFAFVLNSLLWLSINANGSQLDCCIRVDTIAFLWATSMYSVQLCICPLHRAFSLHMIEAVHLGLYDDVALCLKGFCQCPNPINLVYHWGKKLCSTKRMVALSLLINLWCVLCVPSSIPFKRQHIGKLLL